MNRRTLHLSACALPTLAACASVNTKQITTANAVVETVDPVSRDLLLRGDGGSQSGPLLSMIVGSHVQRLNEPHRGFGVLAEGRKTRTLRCNVRGLSTEHSRN